MKKILFISPVKGMWPFVENLSAELKKNNYEIHILDHEEHKLIDYNKGSSQKLIPFLPKLIPFSRSFIRIRLLKIIDNKYKKIYSNLIGKYNVTLILYHFDKLNKYADIISKTSQKLVIAYAGSDFYNIKEEKRNENKLLLIKAEHIVFGNPYMKNDFIAYYKNFESKIKISGMGLSNLDIIKQIKQNEKLINSKKKLNIPTDKIIISIGYTGDRRHRHLEFLENLNMMPHELFKNLYFLFPMTYIKTDQYIEEVSQKANKLNLNFKVFKTLLTDEDICRVRIVTDIAVHIATMDQSSASMMEHLFAGNVVIAGKWLPYKFWDDMGVYSHRVNEKEVIKTFSNVLEKLKEEKVKSQNNPNIIYNNWSWEKRIKKWIEIL